MLDGVCVGLAPVLDDDVGDEVGTAVSAGSSPVTDIEL